MLNSQQCPQTACCDLQNIQTHFVLCLKYSNSTNCRNKSQIDALLDYIDSMLVC